MKSFLILILFLSLSVFGQEGNITPEVTDPAAIEVPEGEDVDQKDIEELSSLRAERAKKVDQVEKTGEALQKAPYNALEELEKLGYKTFEELNFWDEKVVTVIRRGLQESDIYNQNPEIQRAIIMGQVKGSSLEQLFLRYPKLLELTRALIADREAIPALLGIFLKKDQLKLYLFIFFCMIILTFTVRKFVIRSLQGKSLKRVGGFFVNIAMAGITLIIFYEMFETELGPALRVIKTFF